MINNNTVYNAIDCYNTDITIKMISDMDEYACINKYNTMSY